MSKRTPVIFLDANLIYKNVVRDLAITLSINGVIAIKWSEPVLEEARRALQKHLPGKDWHAMIRLMNHHVTGAMVSDFDDHVPDIALPDPNDMHVLAAALKAEADVILTENVRDFPRKRLASLGIEARHPDEFFNELYHGQATHVRRCIAQILHRNRRSPKTLDEYRAVLKRNRLFRFSKALAKDHPS